MGNDARKNTRKRTDNEEADEEREEARDEREEAVQGHRHEQESEGREVKRLACKYILAATVAKNGSNIKSGKHRRASLKRRTKEANV